MLPERHFRLSEPVSQLSHEDNNPFVAFTDLWMVLPDGFVSGLDERMQVDSLAQDLAQLSASFPPFFSWLNILKLSVLRTFLFS